MKTLILMFVSLLTTIASAKDLVTAQLLADVATIAPGDSFTVGVKLKLEPGWHVYWINPGDTGIPTKVKWTVPDGFEVGELQYPIPHKFDVTGGITAYGYEDQVMLIATVKAPKDLKNGSEVTIGATTKWLVCNPDQCIPGEGKSQLKLKVAPAKPQAANVSEFEQWRGQLPTKQGDPKVQLQINAPNGQFKSATGKITLDWKTRTPEKVEWFPIPTEQLLITPGEINTEKGVTTIGFKADALAGEKILDASFSSVVAYTIDGKRTGAVVPVNIVPASKGP